MLLKEDSVCRYGAINTDVIFNNSLGGGQRDLLIKLPFEESWPGMFELTMEVWHNAHPKKILQLQAQSKKSDDKGILATIFDTSVAVRALISGYSSLSRSAISLSCIS